MGDRTEPTRIPARHRGTGKREVGTLNAFDLVVLLFLSNILQNSIIGEDVSVTGGFIGAATLIGANYVVQRRLFKHPRLARLLEGSSSVLVEKGRIDRQALDAEAITEDQLMLAVRKEGIEEIQGVETAVLETDGTISVIPRAPAPASDPDVAARLERIEGLLHRFLPPEAAAAPA